MDLNCASYNSEDDDIGDLELFIELAALSRRILHDLTIARVLCPLEDSRIDKLQNEWNQLRQHCMFLEEQIKIAKQKRWCNWCPQEAVFLSENQRFYCSTKCEKLDILLSDDF